MNGLVQSKEPTCMALYFVFPLAATRRNFHAIWQLSKPQSNYWQSSKWKNLERNWNLKFSANQKHYPSFPHLFPSSFPLNPPKQNCLNLLNDSSPSSLIASTTRFIVTSLLFVIVCLQPQTHGITTGGQCVPCHCNSFGSKSFDCDETGQCRCQPGVTGPKCDRCSRGFFNFQEGGCTRKPRQKGRKGRDSLKSGLNVMPFHWTKSKRIVLFYCYNFQWK